MNDRESIDYVKNVIENSEKVFFAGQPANEVKLYTTDKGLEMLKRVVELAEQVSCLSMREETPEEQKAVEKYLKKISKPTGENFWDSVAESEDKE